MFIALNYLFALLRLQRYNIFSNRQNSKGGFIQRRSVNVDTANDFIDTLEEVVFNVKTASFSFSLPFISGTHSLYLP